jgi:hypothetical protein
MMTLDEQVAEVSEILALAYLRLHQKCLEPTANHEALCEEHGGGDGAAPDQERVA